MSFDNSLFFDLDMTLLRDYYEKYTKQPKYSGIDNQMNISKVTEKISFWMTSDC